VSVAKWESMLAVIAFHRNHQSTNDYRHPVAASNVSKSQGTRPATWVHDFVLSITGCVFAIIVDRLQSLDRYEAVNW
jgi:hypothetical protein